MSVYIKDKTTGKFLAEDATYNTFALITDVKKATDFNTKQFAQFYIDELSTPNPHAQFEVVEINN